MLRLGTVIILALLLSPFPAHAELWRCPQADGSDVLTDKLTDPSTCQQYEAEADFNVVPSSSTTALSEVGPSRRAFTQQELDQMLAPIALYPDSLLSQILMASTYPLEVVEAARWSRANPDLKGDQAVRAVEQNSWDPSVKSLAAFPQVLQMMDEKLDWTERLGDAFLAQQAQVTDTVQNLRHKAYDAGNLKSTDQVRVDQQGQTIVVEPARPEVIYVPYYDPAVIYGPWWWPAYPPVYWAPWPGYFVGPRFAVGFTWGVGIPVGVGFFFGAFDWPHRHITVVNVNNFYFRTGNVNRVTVWQHDPVHRRGVLYRDASLRQQFRRTSASPEVRRDFRGHEPSSFEGRREFGNRQEARGGPGSRPEQRGSLSGRMNVPDVSRSSPRIAPSRPSAPSGVSPPPHFEQRPHAFEGVGHGADVRTFSSRGHASFQGSAPRSSGSFRGGSGSSHH
ncbi:MAG: DUF3300 domain-containing protein [Nitrospirae bacterium]|nr:MAG: DUF3300 domain-containing protein [Nitrospirota bacterium]